MDFAQFRLSILPRSPGWSCNTQGIAIVTIHYGSFPSSPRRGQEGQENKEKKQKNTEGVSGVPPARFISFQELAGPQNHSAVHFPTDLPFQELISNFLKQPAAPLLQWHEVINLCPKTTFPTPRIHSESPREWNYFSVLTHEPEKKNC